MTVAMLRVNVGNIEGSGPSNQWVITLNLCPGTTVFSAGCAGLLTTSLTLNNANSAAGQTFFTGLSFASTSSFGVQLLIAGDRTAGNDVILNWIEADFGTPEPMSYVLVGTGLTALGYLRRRRRGKLSA
jgi:hypothetical protein